MAGHGLVECYWDDHVRQSGAAETVQRIAGRAGGTTLMVAGDWARVVVPGIADVVFTRRDLVRARHPPAGRNGLTNMNLDVRTVLDAFLDQHTVDIVDAWTFAADMRCVLIPLRPHMYWCAQLDGDAYYRMPPPTTEPTIHIEGARCSLVLPERPDAWAHFDWPAAWRCAPSKRRRRDE
jgi:hypothetical protein